LDAERGQVSSGGRLAPRIALLVITAMTAGAAGLWWLQSGGPDAQRPDRLRQAQAPAFVAATTTDASGPIRSLAVLPLEQFSPEAGGEQDYFSAGMHEALISRLSQTSSARIISRTSAMEYDRSGKSMPQIGQELGVDAVVEGSVLRAGERVRITVQLIHAASDTHLWAQDYERDFTDVIALQAEVAGAIAAEIQARVEGRSAEDGADRIAAAEEATSAEAQDAFMRGRFALNAESPEQVDAALDHFQEALDHDSTFTPALVGLAGGYVLRGMSGDTPALPQLIEARRLARRAVESDPRSVEAAEVLATTEQALIEHAQSLSEELLVSDAGFEIRQLAGDSVMLITGGDSTRVARDRIMPIATEFGGLLQTVLARGDMSGESVSVAPILRGIRRLEASGRGADALARSEEAVVRFPQEEAAWVTLEHLQAMTGDLEGLIETRAERESLFGAGPGPATAELARAVEEGGAAAYWGWRLEELTARRSAGESVRALDEAEVLAALGRHEESLDALARAVEERDPGLAALRTNPVWDPLRPLPQFQDILRSVQTLGPPRGRSMGG